MGGIQNNIRDIQIIGIRTRETIVGPEMCPPFRQHAILLAGFSRASTEFHFVRNRPEMFQVLACMEGSGRVLVGGEWKECRAGTAYATCPDSLHAYRASRAWRVAWVTLRRDAVDAVSREAALVGFDATPLASALEGLCAECVSGSDLSAMEHWAGLLHLYALKAFRNSPEPRLSELWRRVREDLAHPWRLEKLARVAGIGDETLRAVCLKETGSSPMAHLASLRMQQALSLLSLGHKVEYVARAVGYGNPFAFSTAFKRAYGRPPSRFAGR